MDCDRYSENEAMGEVRINVDEMDLTKSVEVGQYPNSQWPLTMNANQAYHFDARAVHSRFSLDICIIFDFCTHLFSLKFIYSSIFRYLLIN